MSWVENWRRQLGQELIGIECDCGEIILRPKAACPKCGLRFTPLETQATRRGGVNLRFTKEGELFSINGERVNLPIEIEGTVFEPREVKLNSLEMRQGGETIGHDH